MISSVLLTIKNIFADMAIDYMRATNFEANYNLEKKLIPGEGIAIQVDQTTVTATGSPSAVINVPVEIFFVFKEVSQDETLEDTDVLVDSAEKLAHEFYDRLSLDPLIENQPEPLGEYELQRLEAYKLFDTVVSGILMTLEIPVLRETYYCNTP